MVHGLIKILSGPPQIRYKRLSLTKMMVSSSWISMTMSRSSTGIKSTLFRITGTPAYTRSRMTTAPISLTRSPSRERKIFSLQWTTTVPECKLPAVEKIS